MADEPQQTSETLQKRPRGWRIASAVPPRRGKGTATVEPIRERRDIEAIKLVLAARPRDLALFITGCHLGLRGGDLLSLRWGDVLDGTGAIKGQIAVIESKTKKVRRLAVQPNAVFALEKWRDAAPRDRSHFVFPGKGGERMTTGRLHQLVREWTQLAGVAGSFGSHSIRKTFGYHLRQAGVSIEVIMSIFGHTSQEVTMRYLGLTQDERDKACMKLEL